MYMMQIDISIFLFYYNIKKILPIIVATHSDSGMKVKHTFEQEFQCIYQYYILSDRCSVFNQVQCRVLEWILSNAFWQIIFIFPGYILKFWLVEVFGLQGT